MMLIMTIACIMESLMYFFIPPIGKNIRMTNFEIIKKLIGPIDPVGVSETDAERLENMKAMCELAEQILTHIDNVSCCNSMRKESSVVTLCNYGIKFLERIGFRTK